MPGPRTTKSLVAARNELRKMMLSISCRFELRDKRLLKPFSGNGRFGPFPVNKGYEQSRCYKHNETIHHSRNSHGGITQHKRAAGNGYSECAVLYTRFNADGKLLC